MPALFFHHIQLACFNHIPVYVTFKKVESSKLELSSDLWQMLLGEITHPKVTIKMESWN